MENSTLMQQMFQDYLQNGGQPKITSFRLHLEKLMKTEIKHLCGGSRRLAPGAHDWRNELKARFGGRGNKWMKVSIQEINPSLDKFDAEGYDTEDYRSHIERAGFAWIRYYGPKLNNGIKVAAFTVHTFDATIYQPQTQHYIPVDRLDETITPLNGTPFNLKLEESGSIDQNDTDDEVTPLDEESANLNDEILDQLQDLELEDL